MNLQYSLPARLELALVLGEKFRIRIAGKPTLDRPTLAGGAAECGFFCPGYASSSSIAAVKLCWLGLT
jgi:hypothetical protein